LKQALHQRWLIAVLLLKAYLMQWISGKELPLPLQLFRDLSVVHLD
jgi:hypothetical protein